MSYIPIFGYLPHQAPNPVLEAFGKTYRASILTGEGKRGRKSKKDNKQCKRVYYVATKNGLVAHPIDD